MRKKVILAFLLTMAALFSLSGCKNNSVTPESLIDNSHPKGMTIDASIAMYADCTVDMTGSGINGPIVIDMIIDMHSELQTNGDLEHLKAKITITGVGEDSTESTEQWSTPTRMWVYDNDTWYTAAGEYDTSAEADIVNLNSSAFKNLKMRESDDEYIVTGEVNTDNQEGSTLSPDTLMGLTSGSELKMAVEMRFDKETRYMKSLHMDVTSAEDSDIKYNAFTYNCIINSISEDPLEIPEEVLNSAIDVTSELDDE